MRLDAEMCEGSDSCYCGSSWGDICIVFMSLGKAFWLRSDRRSTCSTFVISSASKLSLSLFLIRFLNAVFSRVTESSVIFCAVYRPL